MLGMKKRYRFENLHGTIGVYMWHGCTTRSLLYVTTIFSKAYKFESIRNRK